MEEVAAESEGFGVFDAHGRYVRWFKWGLVLHTIPIATLILLRLVPQNWFQYALTGFLSCVSGSLLLSWWVLGLLWRFSTAGSFAAGNQSPAPNNAELIDDEAAETFPFQVRSGRFMLWYYVLSIGTLALSLLLSLALTLFLTCCFKGLPHPND